MTKFTPGPWIPVDNDHCVEVRKIGPIGGGDKLICEVEVESEEEEANLNLIAAAPDLFDVIVRLLRDPEDKPPFDEAHAAFEVATGREWDDKRDGWESAES